MNYPRIRITIETSESPVEGCCMASIIQEEDQDRFPHWESVFARAILRLQALGEVPVWHFLADIIVELAELEASHSKDDTKLAQAEEKLIAAADAVAVAWEESRRHSQAVAC
jgi:hypothetical protein